MSSPSTDATPDARGSVSIVLRVLSGVAGAILFVLVTLFTAGTALAAPLGMLLMRRRAVLLNRPLSRIASLVGAMIASSVAAFVLGVVVFVVSPPGTFRAIAQQAAQSQARPSVKLPPWYTRIFPQAARNDSASRLSVRPPGFVRGALAFSGVIMALLLGVVAGAGGWSAAR